MKEYIVNINFGNFIDDSGKNIVYQNAMVLKTPETVQDGFRGKKVIKANIHPDSIPKFEKEGYFDVEYGLADNGKPLLFINKSL